MRAKNSSRSARKDGAQLHTLSDGPKSWCPSLFLKIIFEQGTGIMTDE
jgi:hypothetical protein